MIRILIQYYGRWLLPRAEHLGRGQCFMIQSFLGDVNVLDDFIVNRDV
jgi:hypothetical protein